MASPLTSTYGGLKGWQWAAVVGAAGGLWLFLRSRSSTSGAASSTTGSPAGTAASAGFQPLTTVVLQNGPPSQPLPTLTGALAPIGIKLPVSVSGQSALGQSMVKVTGKKIPAGIPTYLWSAKSKSFFQGSKTDAGHNTLYVPGAYAQYVG